ncbi:MAG: HAD family hydrolase [Planctomycetaceae bacterium]|nr:HAD family hydrolase [Planctomycetaceae bacterium]
MPRYILFDIDGTLVDSVDLHAEAWQVIFRKYGKEIPFQKVRDQIGKGGDQLLPVFWSQEELKSFGKEMEDERSKLFLDEYMPRVKPFPQVPELFQRLLADGKKIALATSAKEKELKQLKKIAGIEGLFHEATSSDDAEKSKPHPDIFAAALEEVGDPQARDAISIGDTPYDAEAAGKIGLKTVGVLCGGWSEADLRSAGCVAIYRDPADLLAKYEESPLK